VQDRKFICPCYRHEQDIAETGHCICHLFVSEDYVPQPLESPPLLQEGSPWPPIRVYGAVWCMHTRRTRHLLNRQGVPYTYVDVDFDEEAAEQVKAWNRGYLSTPTLDIGGQIVTEPSNAELAELLGLSKSD
jgi:mycoredoxin